MDYKRKLRSATRPATSTESSTTSKNACIKLPKYSFMIKDAITNLKQSNGSSEKSIINYIYAKYNLEKGDTVIRSLTQAIHRSIKNDELEQVRKGYFKLKGRKYKSKKENELSHTAVTSPKATNKPSGTSEGRKTRQINKRTKIIIPKQEPAKQKKSTRNKGKSSIVTSTSRRGDDQTAGNGKEEKLTVTSSTTKKSKAKAKSRRGKGKEKTNATKQRMSNKDNQQKTMTVTKRLSAPRNQRKARQKIRKAGQKTDRKLSLSDPFCGTNEATEVTQQPSGRVYKSLTLHQKLESVPQIRLKLLHRYSIGGSNVFAVASSGRILAVGELFNTVKLYSSENRLLSCLELKDKPCNIAVFSDNEALITTGNLMYMVDFSRDFLSISYTFFSTDYFVCGVTSCLDYIYVTCFESSPSVKMTDTSGNIYWSVNLSNDKTEDDKRRLSISSFTSEGKVTLVVTDAAAKSITLLDGETGEVQATRKTTSAPCSTTIDVFGNIYVCYPALECVTVLSTDLSTERVVLATNEKRATYPEAVSHYLFNKLPRNIDYDQILNRLVIGFACGVVQVFQLDV